MLFWTVEYLEAVYFDGCDLFYFNVPRVGSYNILATVNTTK